MSKSEVKRMAHQNPIALIEENERLRAELAGAREVLLDIPWNVVEATEVDETIAAWFLKRDEFLYGGGKERKP